MTSSCPAPSTGPRWTFGGIFELPSDIVMVRTDILVDHDDPFKQMCILVYDGYGPHGASFDTDVAAESMYVSG